MESYTVTKRNQLLTQATQWMNFKNVILNEKKFLHKRGCAVAFGLYKVQE